MPDYFPVTSATIAPIHGCVGGLFALYFCSATFPGTQHRNRKVGALRGEERGSQSGSEKAVAAGRGRDGTRNKRNTEKLFKRVQCSDDRSEGRGNGIQHPQRSTLSCDSLFPSKWCLQRNETSRASEEEPTPDLSRSNSREGARNQIETAVQACRPWKILQSGMDGPLYRLGLLA